MENLNYINYDWSLIQKYYDDGHYWDEVSKKFIISIKTIRKYRKNGYLVDRSIEEQKNLLAKTRKIFKHTDETKMGLSIWRKNYLRDNPDKIKWTGNESAPSMKFKNILNENDISFVEEFKPIEDRFFNIDVAFPDKKIGIEINGEQHYERDGELKKYYQDRHDLIESNGWKLYEIHTSLVYKKMFIEEFILELKNDFNLGNIDYSFYMNTNKFCECGKNKSYGAKLCYDCFKKSIKKKEINKIELKERKEKIKKQKITKKLCECGNKKTKESKLCLDCFNKKDRSHLRKVERPEYDKLLKDIKDIGYSATGRKYGVCDNTIRKWIKVYKKANVS